MWQVCGRGETKGVLPGLPSCRPWKRKRKKEKRAGQLVMKSNRSYINGRLWLNHLVKLVRGLYCHTPIVPAIYSLVWVFGKCSWSVVWKNQDWRRPQINHVYTDFYTKRSLSRSQVRDGLESKDSETCFASDEQKGLLNLFALTPLYMLSCWIITSHCIL